MVRNLDAENKNKAMSARKTLLAVKKRTNVSQKRRANIDYQSLVDSGYLRRSSRLMNGS